MFTLFSTPKAFSGHAGIIQDNALQSWRRLGQGIEIILFGDDPGVAEAAVRHGVGHVAEMARTAEGAPMVRGVFNEADRRARHPLLCYVNADMILMDEFIKAVRAAASQRQKFLLVSSRFNLDIEQPLDFAAGWQENLRARVRREASMYPAAGSDFFVYPRGLLADLPPFALGRGYWDNGIMFAAKRRGAALIDLTPEVLAVHQNHGYSHVAGLGAGERSELAVLAGRQGADNLRLAGGYRQLYTVYDCDFVLRDGRLASTLRPGLIGRRLKASLRRRAMMASPRLLRAYHRLRGKFI